jgi:hypothetical protein
VRQPEGVPGGRRRGEDQDGHDRPARLRPGPGAGGKELPHVYAFDVDLDHCGRCGRHRVYAWFSVGGWQPVTADDAAQWRALDGAALRAFMKNWAEPCN